MAKLSKDELIAKINDKLSDNSELAVELMEDITDSFVELDASEYEKQIEEEKAKYEDLLQRYKDRFVSADVIPGKTLGTITFSASIVPLLSFKTIYTVYKSSEKEWPLQEA